MLVNTVVGMGLEADLQVQIARLAVAHTRAALPSQAYVLASAHAFGNFEFDLMVLDGDAALCIHLGHAQADAALAAVVSLFKVNLDFGVAVFTVGVEGLMVPAASTARWCLIKAPAEQRLKKITVLGRFILRKALFQRSRNRRSIWAVA